MRTGAVRNTAIWLGLVLILGAPLIAAANSPLLAWREPVYILAGFAGIIALALLLIQPLLAMGTIPGFPARLGRRVHRGCGVGLIAAVVIHVGGLWITSPPDVIDALLFVSPTPFSIWGVIAMWALFGTGLLAVFRKKLRLRIWQAGHICLGAIIVTGTIIHALLIEGTMEPITKIALCTAVFAATAGVSFKQWRRVKQ